MRKSLTLACLTLLDNYQISFDSFSDHDKHVDSVMSHHINTCLKQVNQALEYCETMDEEELDSLFNQILSKESYIGLVEEYLVRGLLEHQASKR